MSQAKNNVADSATDIPDLSKQDPYELMRQAAELADIKENQERILQQKKYESSPTGKLEAKYASKLPTYDPASIKLRHERGGFFGNQYEVEGLPARLVHMFVPRSQLHDWSEIWRPFDAEDAAMTEAGIAQGKVYIRRTYTVINNMICTGMGMDDMVMVVADRETYERRILDRTGNWNDKFSRTAPAGQFAARMESSEPGRTFQVQGERFDQAQLSGTLLSAPGEGE